MIFEQFLGLSLACTSLVIGCTTDRGTSGETHFVACSTDAACATLGSGHSCIDGICRRAADASVAREAGVSTGPDAATEPEAGGDGAPAAREGGARGAGEGGAVSCADPPVAYGAYRVSWVSSYPSSWAGAVSDDGSGNALLLGGVDQRITVGSMEIAPPTSEGLNTFVAKIDPSGHTAWARVFVGAEPASIAATPSGDVYVLANAVRNVDVGTGPLPNGSFVAKLGSSGATKWARILDPGNPNGSFDSLAADANGNIALLGTPVVATGFGSSTIPAGPDLVSFDSNGTFRFALPLQNFKMRTPIAFDGTGSLHLGDGATGALQIGSTTVPATSGLLDVVVDAQGNVVRARRIGQGSVGGLVATNQSDGYVLGGRAAGAVDLGSGPIPDAGLVLAWLDATGTVTKTKVFSSRTAGGLRAGRADTIGPSVALDPAGQVLFSDVLETAADLGGGPLVPRPVLAAVLGADGSHVFSGAYGGPGDAYPTAVARDRSGFWVLGNFSESLDLGGMKLGTPFSSLFLARFEPGTPPPPAGRRCVRGDPAPAGANALTLEYGASGRAGLTASADEVYFSDGAAIFSEPVGGGDPTVLAYGRRSVVGLTSDGGALYWAETGVAGSTPGSGNGAIATVPLSGGDVTVLAANEVNPSAMALSQGSIYWLTTGSYDATGSGEGELRVLSLSDGGAPRTLASHLAAPSALSVNGTTIVFAASSATAGMTDIVRTDTSGATPVVVASSRGVGATALDGSNVYWTVPATNGVDFSNADGQVLSVSLGAAGPPALLANAQNDPVTLVFDGSAHRIVWSTSGSFGNSGSTHDAAMFSVDASTGNLQELVSGRASISTFARTPAGIVWSEIGFYPSTSEGIYLLGP